MFQQIDLQGLQLTRASNWRLRFGQEIINCQFLEWHILIQMEKQYHLHMILIGVWSTVCL